MKGRHVVIVIFVFGLSLMAILFRVLEKAQPVPPPKTVVPPPVGPPTPPPPPTLPPPDEQTAGRIEVLVRSKGAPVRGATVSFQLLNGMRAYQLTSGADGKCAVPFAEPGEWRIVARAPGVAPGIKRVTVETGATAGAELDLAAGVRLEGVVRDAAGNPVAGAKISMSLPDPAFTARSDATGRYFIPDVPVGSHAITASSDRFRPQTISPLELTTPGQTVPLDFLLPFGASVAGRVLDESGAPVARASVTVSNEVARVVRTDENGEFRAEGLGEGLVTLSVVARGFGPAAMQGVAPGASGVALTLKKAASLVGRIEGSTSSFSVHLSRFDETLSRWIVARSASFGAESNGAFQFRDLAAGR
ncbi:MAG TPA: carboxypeptidase-like regulatory domain-containing protein, partial [Planctomycetota bacterium]|nr:carboxypeptidase-like regulatory domain-containing protein [Planctomycetota bacterium]